MNTYKKFFGRFMAVVLVVSMVGFTGCKSDTSNDKISIVCTIFPQYDFVRQLTKDMDNVEITMLLKPGQESHDYDPSSKDVLKIHKADVFIYVGGESDTWILDVLSTVENKSQIRLKLMDMVEVKEEEEIPGMEAEHKHEEDHDHEHEELYDEHVWTSPVNAIKIVKGISKTLSSFDKIDKSVLETNTESYVKALETLNTKIEDTVKNATGDTIVVADRFPLLYFCKEYDIKYFAAFSGCATSVEPSTSTLIFLINKVKELDTKYIVAMEMSAAATAKHIAGETGAEVLYFNSCHNVTNDDLKAGVTYIDLMERNIEILNKILNY